MLTCGAGRGVDVVAAGAERRAAGLAAGERQARPASVSGDQRSPARHDRRRWCWHRRLHRRDLPPTSHAIAGPPSSAGAIRLMASAKRRKPAN